MVEMLPPRVAGLAVKPLPFEEGAFGAPVWRVDVGDGVALDPVALANLSDEARAQGVALISARLPAGHVSNDALRDAGFRLVERLLILRREIPGEYKPQPDVTLAHPNDAEACAAIARRSFSSDRFHADPKLPDPLADEIKARWARNGVEGRADASLVVHAGPALAGFCLCMRSRDDAMIDLMAVDAPYRRNGLGRWLVRGSLAHYAGRARHLFVKTQQMNAASLGLYQSEGFTVDSVSLTWHWTA